MILHTVRIKEPFYTLSIYKIDVDLIVYRLWTIFIALHLSSCIRTVVLGNAYLSLFFITNQDAKVLKQCSSAYSQAVSLQSWQKLPSFSSQGFLNDSAFCTGFSRLSA